MAKFYTATNNGVTAVVTEGVYKALEERKALVREAEAKGLGTPQLPPVGPIFTFAREKHGGFKFMTGSITLMHRLLDGHEVVGGSIWVPFSNGVQWGHMGIEEQSYELLLQTSLDEAIEAFGLHS